MVALSTPALDKGFCARDFYLKSVDGSYYGLADFTGGKALLVMFICNHCPYVKAIIGRLVKHVTELVESHDVRAVAIMPNDTSSYPEDSYDNMVAFATKQSLSFPYLIDESQDVARSYGAVCTPDFFCFDSSLQLKYRGRFDKPTNNGDSETGYSELYHAVRFISETGGIPENQVPSIGCSIKWRNDTERN